MISRRALVSAALLSPLVASPHVARASAWPTRPIKIIVPFGPGGSADVVARYVARPLQDILGQSIIIENRTGAAGTIGADLPLSFSSTAI
jgi:tripartite-type tricarboxylate transporter receptor subunit TctC